MRSLVMVVAVGIVVLMLSRSTSAVAMLAQPFEGTKWKAVVTPDDATQGAGAKEFQTVLEFKGGKFTSSECLKHGYKPVEYKEETSPGGLAANFTAEPVSEKDGKEKWRGDAMAGEMRGELTVTKKDGTVLNFTFHAERTAK